MPRKPRQIKTSLYLDEDTLQKLKEISKKTMIPMARLLRKAVEQIIAEYSK